MIKNKDPGQNEKTSICETFQEKKLDLSIYLVLKHLSFYFLLYFLFPQLCAYVLSLITLHCQTSGTLGILATLCYVQSPPSLQVIVKLLKSFFLSLFLYIFKIDMF